MDKERLKDLLFAYLNTSLSREEYEELQNYIIDDTYSDVFYASMDTDIESGNLKELVNDRERDNFYNRVITHERFNEAQVRSITSKRWWTGRRGVAAAAAVLLLVVSAWLLTTYKSDMLNSKYANDVSPGSNKAVLTLANGKKIQLNGNHQGVIAAQSGTNVTQSGKSALVYQAPDEMNSGQPITYNTLETPKGGKYELKLPDGSLVWLNAGSSITFPVSFSSLKERRIKLTGEAYFEVSHEKDRPFRVETGKQTLEVLGTHFNINGYADEQAVKSTLLEGRVKININNTASALLLKPGEQAQVGESDSKVIPVDTELAIDWKNGDFILKDEDFKTTMRKIARWYDVDIVYDPSLGDDIELGGWVSRSKKLSTVLDVIEASNKNVHFKINGRRITVSK